MDFGISTQIYRKQRLTVDLLESIRKAGYAHIELFCCRPDLDFHDRKLLHSLARWFQENQMPAPSIHLPFFENIGPHQNVWFSVVDSERRLRALAMDEIKRSLDLAELISPAYVVMHLGNPEDKFSPVMFDYAYAAIAQIRAFAGVRIMVENIPNEISTIERILEFKAAAQVSDIGICYDTGHGYLQGNTSGLEHIHTTHVHDNHGETDEHLWPFEGSIHWPALVEKLIAAKYDGSLVFETRGDLTKGGDVRSRLQDLWDQAQNSIDEFRERHKLES